MQPKYFFYLSREITMPQNKLLDQNVKLKYPEKAFKNSSLKKSYKNAFFPKKLSNLEMFFKSKIFIFWM